MENPFTRPYTPSSVDDSEFLLSVQIEMLETKLDNAHSETKKAKAAFENLLEFAASRVQASKDQLCDSHIELGFVKEVRHLKRKLDRAQNETRNTKAGFEGLFNMVVSLRSDLSGAHASELEYVKEITRLNVLLRKAEADIERLKSRYREATYANAGEAAKRYSQDATLLATLDGEFRDDDEATQAGADIDVQQAQSDTDTEDRDVDVASVLALNGDKADFDSDHSVNRTNGSKCGILDGVSFGDDQFDIHKEPVMIDTKHGDAEVIKETTSRGSDSANGEDHILDSPIGDDLNFEQDISIILARLKNGERDLSQFSPDTLACLMELEEPFTSLTSGPVSSLTKEVQQEYRLSHGLSVTAVVVNGDREHDDGLGSVAVNGSAPLSGTSAPPILKSDNELAKELRDIDFFELEDILGKDFVIKTAIAQDEALTKASDQQVTHDSLATEIGDDLECIMGAFQGEEYLAPDPDFNGVQHTLYIKGEALLDAELAPAVLQVGLDVKRLVFKGGNYLKKQVAKGGKYFSRRVLKGSKCSTELGPFDSPQERDAAIRSNRRYAGRHDRTFPDLFRHGISYKPSATDTNILRTIHIGNLPNDITLYRLLTRIRGGAIVSAVICDTVRITGSKSALVVFQDANAASAYVKFAANYLVGFEYQRVEVTLVPTPTWPMPIPVQKRMEDKKQTRCLNIPSFIRPDPDPQTPIEEQKRNQYFIDLLKEELSGFNRLRFEAIYDAYMDEDNMLHLSFASIQAAGTAYGILQREKNKDLGAKAFFVADPCAKPLQDLVHPEEMEVYFDDEEVEGSDVVVDDQTDSEDGQGVGEKFYGAKNRDKIDSEEDNIRQHLHNGMDGMEMRSMTQLETGDVTVSTSEAPVVGKTIVADMEHYEAGVTSFDQTTQNAITTELAELSVISDVLLSDPTSSPTRTSSLEGPLHTPSNSTSSTSSSLPIITPASSPSIAAAQDTLNNQNSPGLTGTNNLDLGIISNTSTVSFATVTTSIPLIAQRVKTRPERQSWADIMIEEAEMEQIFETAISQAEAKRSSDSVAKVSPPIASSPGNAPSTVSSTAPSSQAKCPICPNDHANTEKTATYVTAPGQNGNDGTLHSVKINTTTAAQALPRVICVPIPATATGPMARITNAGIGGMRACACNGDECCVSGCLCRSASAV